MQVFLCFLCASVLFRLNKTISEQFLISKQIFNYRNNKNKIKTLNFKCVNHSIDVNNNMRDSVNFVFDMRKLFTKHTHNTHTLTRMASIYCLAFVAVFCFSFFSSSLPSIEKQFPSHTHIGFLTK